MLQQPRRLTPDSSDFLAYFANTDEALSALARWAENDPSYAAHLARLRRWFANTFGIKVAFDVGVISTMLTGLPPLIKGEIRIGADPQAQNQIGELDIINTFKEFQDKIMAVTSRTRATSRW